jgi:hypothetical protein
VRPSPFLILWHALLFASSSFLFYEQASRYCTLITH